MTRKYTKTKQALLEKYYLSRMDILKKKFFYIEDFKTWGEANKHSKHMIRSTLNCGFEATTEIFLSVRVANAKKQSWMVKTALHPNSIAQLLK